MPARDPVELARKVLAPFPKEPLYLTDGDPLRDLAKALISTSRRAEAMEKFLLAPMREIAHWEGYDGSLCADPEDCPNCTAQAALKNYDNALGSIREEEGEGDAS